MNKAIVIYGIPGNGKTHASQILAKKLKLRLIIFDVIINLISEIVRNRFGEDNFKDELEIYFTKIFQTKNDIDGFKSDLEVLISKNEKYFQHFYEKFVKERSSFMNKQIGDPKNLFDLGRNGDALESFAENILKLILKYVIKKTPIFIIEGYHFNAGKNFRKGIEKLCDEVLYVGCFYKNKDVSYNYKFNENSFSSLVDLENELNNVIHANRFEENPSVSSKVTKEKQKSEEIETPSTNEINLHDVENLLLTLYNRNSFFRILFKFGYKILKKFSKT